MPKLKTHSGAKKRFNLTKNGKVKRAHANKSHIPVSYTHLYTVLLDYEKLESESVVAIIEVKVMPKRDLGFDEIASRISEYSEVDSVYLMSGAYDLALIVECRTFKDVAIFVQQRLASLDSVMSTATHFVLVRYKEKGTVLCETGFDDNRRSTLL